MLPLQTIYKFAEFEIKDKYGQVWYPISAVSDSSFTLYLVSKFDKGYKNTLVYYSKYYPTDYVDYLSIGDSNSIPIFGGMDYRAAIDSERRIIYIPLIKRNSSFVIEPQSLPNGEKAVELACGSFYYLALSSNGKIFFSKISESLKFEFKQIEKIFKEKLFRLLVFIHTF